MKSSLKELDEVSAAATPLEKSNVLMKLRETLVDQAGSDVDVTVPPGISLYPYRLFVWIAGWVSLLVLCVSGLALRSVNWADL